MWWSLKRSPALFILTDDRRRIMDTSSGHRDLYKYPDGTNYGVEIDRLSNDELVAAIERAGGAKALYGQSEGFALLSRRDPDRHSNMADCTRWVRYANAPILLDDGRRFWLATGVLEPEGAAQQLVIVN